MCSCGGVMAFIGQVGLVFKTGCLNCGQVSGFAHKRVAEVFLSKVCID